MRLMQSVLTIFLFLAPSPSAQQRFQTPPDGPESAKLAAQYDPTKATVITAADIAAAVSRLPNQPSANGTFIERADPSSITGSVIESRSTGAGLRRTRTRIERKRKCGP
jgi:hypothetical protein